MIEVKAIIQPFMLDKVCNALRQIDGLPGITVSDVVGWGKGRAVGAQETEVLRSCIFASKTQIQIILSPDMMERVIDTIVQAAQTGNMGDGLITVHELFRVIKIRTGWSDEADHQT